MFKTISTYTSILLCIIMASVAGADEKRVMVINSYHADYPWVIAHNDALKERLADKAIQSFYYLDSKRLSPSESLAKAKGMLKTVKESRPDLIILADDFALKELGNEIMLDGIPVVFLGINTNPRMHIGDMTLATGVLERPLLKRSIVYIKDIMEDDLKKCLVLFDNGTTAASTMETVFRGKHSNVFSRTSTDITLLQTFNEWKQTVLTAKDNGYSVIILGLYHTLVDDKGNHVPDEQVATWTSANSPVPVFGFWDFAVGKGKAIGGLILSGAPQGEEAAKLALKVLDGQTPNTLEPVHAEHGRFIFSRSELKRWNITLPAYFDSPNEPLIFVD